MWIYGNRPMDIYTTIQKGRPGGMLPHESFGSQFVQRATAYVLSIKNKKHTGNPPQPNPKRAPPARVSAVPGRARAMAIP